MTPLLGRNASAAVTLTLSVLAMSFADAMVKLVSSDLTIWQVFAARSVFAAACLAALLYATKDAPLLRVSYWIVLRSALLIFTWLAFYASLPLLDLAIAATAVYTNPIWTTVLSALFLGERVTRTQWLGVALGFVGVAVILRPGADGFSMAIFLPLMAAFTYSLAMVLTRNKCRSENPVSLALNLHVAFLLTGVIGSVAFLLIDVGDALRSEYPFLFEHWRSMDLTDWALMGFLGVLSAGFFLGVARAYQTGAPQMMATVDYSYVVFAALWGLILFTEIPTVDTWVGMALVVAAGLISSGVLIRSAQRVTPPKG